MEPANFLNQKTPVIYRTKGKHHFFGYYDKCPWNKKGDLLLALEADFIDRLPEPNNAAGIGFINLKGSGVFERVAETRAWNWQQGAMLQWLPIAYDERIIFNDFRDGRFISLIFNVRRKEIEKALPLSIYAVHPAGRHALSLNFSRLDRMRDGYGYKGAKDNWSHQKAPKEDGIYLLDLTTGKYKLIVSFFDLYNFHHLGLMDEGHHWVDHLTFSSNGERFAFFHRFELRDERVYERLITAKWDGSEMFLLMDSGMVSHFTWRNDEEILCWGRAPGALSGLTKSRRFLSYFVPLYRKFSPRDSESTAFRQRLLGDSFLLLEDKKGKFRRIGSGVLENGHPSFFSDQKRIIIDTYADKEHYRKLFLYDLESNKTILIGRFYALPDRRYSNDLDWDSSPMRADLHPRLNRAGTQVCIDSVHEESRQMYVINLSGMA